MEERQKSPKTLCSWLGPPASAPLTSSTFRGPSPNGHPCPDGALAASCHLYRSTTPAFGLHPSRVLRCLDFLDGRSTSKALQLDLSHAQRGNSLGPRRTGIHALAALSRHPAAPPTPRRLRSACAQVASCGVWTVSVGDQDQRLWLWIGLDWIGLVGWLVGWSGSMGHLKTEVHGPP